MTALTIGRLAKAAGTNAETIRYYEKIGLIAPPARTGGNYRVYDIPDLRRLSFVRRARDLGFSLDQVRTLLNLSDDQSRSCCAVDEIASAQLASVDRKIEDLMSLRRELGSMIEQCSRGTIADCRIIDALAPHDPAPARA